MTAPAPPKNQIERIANRSLNQMTAAAGIAVSRPMRRKNSNPETRTAPVSRARSPLEADAEATTIQVKAMMTAVAAPHPASHPLIKREKVQDISSSLTKPLHSATSHLRRGVKKPQNFLTEPFVRAFPQRNLIGTSEFSWSVSLFMEQAMQPRRPRIKHTLTFEERLAQQAIRLHDAARKMPLGKERNELLKRAKQAETAAGINRWLSSPNLKQPDQQLCQHLTDVLRPKASEQGRDHDR
jgi:hypothetical protein